MWICLSNDRICWLSRRGGDGRQPLAANKTKYVVFAGKSDSREAP